MDRTLVVIRSAEIQRYLYTRWWAKCMTQLALRHSAGLSSRQDEQYVTTLALEVGSLCARDVIYN